VRSDLHRNGTILLSLSLITIGVAIFVRTLTAGGGVTSVGLLLGLLFAIAGAGRLWIAWRKP
jgi:hypothetical protein